MKPFLSSILSLSLVFSSISLHAQEAKPARKVLMTSQELGLTENSFRPTPVTMDESQRPRIEGVINTFNPLEPDDCLRLKKYLDAQPEEKMSQDHKQALKLEVCNQYDWKKGRKIPKDQLQIILIEEVNPKNVQRSEINPYNLPDLGSDIHKSGNQAGLSRDSAYMWILGVLAVAVIAAMPSEVSKWDDDQRSMSYAQDKWYKNVSGGPVMDNDDAKFNLIGHPIAGAGYYVVARKQGFNKMDSFKYSATMSTFFWEFGLEAIAEKPSIQDIIITPGLGSPLGELMYQANEKIESQDGKLLGSRVLGKVGLFVTNPIGEMLQGLQKIAPKIGVKDIEYARWSIENTSVHSPGTYERTPIFGLKISFDGL